jgi:hypothetical protein
MAFASDVLPEGFRCSRAVISINRWWFSPLLLKRFNRRKRPVTGKWHADETYIKVRGQWMYLYRAIDSLGDTVEFWFSEHPDLMAAKRFFRKALARHGRPERIVIDGSQTNQDAIVSCDGMDRLRDRSRHSLKPIRIRQSQYLTDVFDKGGSVPMSCKLLFGVRSGVLPRRTAEKASGAERSTLAGRPPRGMHGLALTKRARRYRSPAAGWIGEADFDNLPRLW